MDLKKYQSYTAIDFAMEQSFLAWVLNPSTDPFWQNYIENHPHQREEIQLAIQMVKAFREASRSHNLSPEEAEQIHSHLMEQTQPKVQALRRPFQVPEWLAWAASIAVLCMLGYTIWMGLSNPTIQNKSTFGELKSLSLPDGSQVVLHANSTLTYAKKWDEHSPREVWLEGEAFFDVEKRLDSLAKFVVHTSDLHVEVLGTEFNINSRRAKTEVVLNEGKIQLNLANEKQEKIFLDPGDMVSFSQEKKMLTQKKVDPRLHISWKEGVQAFEKTPLSELLLEMEEIYGIRLELLRPELAERKLTVGIPIQNLAIALSTIENLLDVQITQKDDMHYQIT